MQVSENSLMAGNEKSRREHSRRRGAVPKVQRRATKTVMPSGAGVMAGIRLAVKGCFAAVFLGVVGLTAVLFYFGRSLPSVEDLANARKEPRIVVLSHDGALLGIHGQDRGKPVHLDDLPPHVIHAFIATEDRNFFHHYGVNPVAVFRALLVNLQEGETRQGGSTITQQTIKNLILTNERTVSRKFDEMLLAFRVEATYSKDEILSIYLNTMYFGNGAFGLEAATRSYFGKAPEDLSIGEAAMLAGLLKAPSRFSPASNPDIARGRAGVVLHAMVDAGFLLPTTADEIIEAGVATVLPEDDDLYIPFRHAVSEAEALVGGFDQDLIIQTTFDRQAIVATQAAQFRVQSENSTYTDDIQSAALALERDGAIRVMIGGDDYFNRATMAKRQPGSVFKPYVYLAALEQGWIPEDIIDDSPIVIEDYEPKNYKDRYYGPVSLNEAMSRSLNAAVIRLQEYVGRDSVVLTARKAGLSGIVDIGPALALGVMETTPLDIARGTLTFANAGCRVSPYSVQTISTVHGEIVYQHSVEEKDLEPVFDPDAMLAFDHMLRRVVRAGSGVRARVPGHEAAGKTGTSQNSRDAWFAGYVSGMVGVTWLGKDDYSPMEVGDSYISGSGPPALLWADMMVAALGGRAPVTPERRYEPPVIPALPGELDTAMDQFVMGLVESGVLGVDQTSRAAKKDQQPAAEDIPLPTVAEESRDEPVDALSQLIEEVASL